MNNGGRPWRRVRRCIRSPISGGSSSAAFLFPCSHLDSGDHNESSVDVCREVSSKREEELSRGTSLGPVAKRWNGQAYPPIGFKIDIPFVGRLTAISRKKSRKTLARVSLSLLLFFFFPFSFLSVSLLHTSWASSFSLSSFYGERQLLRPLPRRVVTTSDNTMAAALPTRLSRADRRERRSSGNYGLSRCALDNRPEDVHGYTRLSQCRLEISSRDDSSINRFWRGLARPSEAEQQDALRVRWRV